MVRQLHRLPQVKSVQKGIQAVLVLIAAAILLINYEYITQFFKNF